MTIPFNKLNGLDWSADDLRKKFNDTFVKATVIQGGIPVVKSDLIYIVDACPGGDAIAWVRSSPDGNKDIHKVLWSGLFVEDDRPDCCISNSGANQAFMFVYNPDRQWKRGFCSYNSFIHRSPNLQLAGLRWEEAKMILQPNHLHLDLALSSFKNKSVMGRALNNRYWLLRNKGEESIRLYRRAAFMGSFVGKKFFVASLANKLLSRELQLELPILKAKYAYKPAA